MNRQWLKMEDGLNITFYWREVRDTLRDLRHFWREFLFVMLGAGGAAGCLLVPLIPLGGRILALAAGAFLIFKPLRLLCCVTVWAWECFRDRNKVPVGLKVKMEQSYWLYVRYSAAVLDPAIAENVLTMEERSWELRDSLFGPRGTDYIPPQGGSA